MKKMIIVALAVLVFASLGTTFAAVENIKVSGDVTAQGISRNLSLNAPDSGVDGESFLLSQVRLRFDADLTEDISAVIGLINERIWDAETSIGTSLDLDLGYIEIKQFLSEPLTLIVGRQNLRYGNALIVGDPDTNRLAAANTSAKFADLSLRKSFDAVRAILDYSPYTLDLVYAKIDEGFAQTDDDITLLGGNLSYEWSSYNGVTEGYVFSALGRSGEQVNENEDYTIVVGARVQFDPTDKITLGLEGAAQFGDYYDNGAILNDNIASTADGQTYHRNAYALQFISEYRFLNDYNGKLGLSYTYLTGEDENDIDKDYEAWDPLFEDQIPGEILNMVAAESNAHFLTLSGSYMPREDITLGAIYTHARYATNPLGLDTTLSVGSAIPTPVAGQSYTIKKGEKHIGDEIDLYGVYDYSEDVQLKLTAAFFIPGDLFEDVNEDAAYSLRAGLIVGF